MNYRYGGILLLLVIIFPPSVFALPAFPGAEGYGAQSMGGRGGQVIKVTNRNDSGSGSLREAVQAPRRHYANGSYQYEDLDVYIARLDETGHRMVVFEVSGIINLESTLMITYPYLTIAGQTSPGGILVTGYQTTVNAHDVVIQHMRFRVGSHRIADGADPETLDSFDILGQYWATVPAYNIIVDHCSFSWGVDETVTVSGGVLNTTIQWCIVSEGLSHAGHPKGEHSKGLLVSGKYVNPSTVTLSHNYIAHNTARSPLIYAPEGVEMVVDAVNNVSYNWHGGISPQSGGAAKVNWVHNYAKQGESSNDYSFEVAHANLLTPAPQIYVLGNIGSTRMSQDEPQWNVGTGWRNELLSEAFRSMSPWASPAVATTPMSYDYAQEILESVGATKPVRDSVDARVVADFVPQTGSIIDDIVYPDDFPTFDESLRAPADLDGDGMADSWEQTLGLNTSEDDSRGDHDDDGYTNIEEYFYYLTTGSEASDTASPTCHISAPTNQAAYDNGNNSSVTLSGTAADDMGVTRVNWSNQATSESGTATGTESWSAADISLAEGDNVIIITASDGVGNTGQDQIVVSYASDGSSNSGADNDSSGGGGGCFLSTLLAPVY